MTFAFSKFAALQRAAAQALQHHDEPLVEAIMHHCALKVASATAPTEELVGRYVRAEIRSKLDLLRMPVRDLSGLAVKGKYLRALSECDEWHRDHGALEALVAGMIGAE